MIFVKLVFVVALVFCAFIFDMGFSVSLTGESWSLPLWKVLVLTFFFLFVCKLLKILVEKLSVLFGIKSDPRKGLDYLQEAFSGMLVKDHKTVWKSLNKAKKHLGEIPFISWLEGQLCLINGDSYKAKSLFFNLSSKEKNTVLGAYSLAQLSLQDRTDKESIESIKAILKVYPNSQNFINQIICLSVKNGNIDDAFYYLRKLSDNNKDYIKAAIYFEKWKQSLDESDLKTAYKLAPHISDIAITYADELLKQDEKKSAGKVLLNSFEKSPCIEIFDKYVSIDAEQVKRGEKLLKIAPQSWVPYYGLAKICEKEDMLSMALDYISRAYDLANYTFIADELTRINSLHNNSETLIDLSKSKNVKFFWRCTKCGDCSKKWKTVCSHCISVASYSYVEELEENLPAIKISV